MKFKEGDRCFISDNCGRNPPCFPGWTPGIVRAENGIFYNVSSVVLGASTCHTYPEDIQPYSVFVCVDTLEVLELETLGAKWK